MAARGSGSKGSGNKWNVSKGSGNKWNVSKESVSKRSVNWLTQTNGHHVVPVVRVHKP